MIKKVEDFITKCILKTNKVLESLIKFGHNIIQKVQQVSFYNQYIQHMQYC